MQLISTAEKCKLHLQTRDVTQRCHQLRKTGTCKREQKGGLSDTASREILEFIKML